MTFISLSVSFSVEVLRLQQASQERRHVYEMITGARVKHNIRYAQNPFTSIRVVQSVHTFTKLVPFSVLIQKSSSLSEVKGAPSITWSLMACGTLLESGALRTWNLEHQREVLYLSHQTVSNWPKL